MGLRAPEDSSELKEKRPSLAPDTGKSTGVTGSWLWWLQGLRQCRKDPLILRLLAPLPLGLLLLFQAGRGVGCQRPQTSILLPHLLRGEFPVALKSWAECVSQSGVSVLSRMLSLRPGGRNIKRAMTGSGLGYRQVPETGGVCVWWLISSTHHLG